MAVALRRPPTDDSPEVVVTNLVAQRLQGRGAPDLDRIVEQELDRRVADHDVPQRVVGVVVDREPPSCYLQLASDRRTIGGGHEAGPQLEVRGIFDRAFGDDCQLVFGAGSTSPERR